MEEYTTWDDSEEHGAAHSDAVRDFEVAETTGTAIVVTYQRNIKGVWQNARTRVASFPPYCRFIEELEGEFAGSKFVVAHRPAGSSMKIDVYGDVQSKSLSGEPLREYWLNILASTHDEDMLALKNYRKRMGSQSQR